MGGGGGGGGTKVWKMHTYLLIPMFLTIQSVQAAVDHQLTTLARTSPYQKVVLVTFNDEVSIIRNKSIAVLANDGIPTGMYTFNP